MKHYLIKFKASPNADTAVVGVLRFNEEKNYDQRQASLNRWLANARPHNPTLSDNEWAWLDEVKVEDAP